MQANENIVCRQPAVRGVRSLAMSAMLAAGTLSCTAVSLRGRVFQWK